jgi:hypothetical protein
MCQPGGFARIGPRWQSRVAGSGNFYQADVWLRAAVLVGSSVHNAKKAGVAGEVGGKRKSRAGAGLGQ